MCTFASHHNNPHCITQNPIMYFLCKTGSNLFRVTGYPHIHNLPLSPLVWRLEL